MDKKEKLVNKGETIIWPWNKVQNFSVSLNCFQLPFEFFNSQ